jgi:glucose-1-phosphate adenylyltransferase
MQDVLGLILGGGRGKGLYPLTKQRSEPAVPIAGKYRLIDIPLSNCINSGLRRLYVLTQFLSVSLHRHISNTYKFGPFHPGFVEVLAAQQTNETADWYQGTADAVRQNVPFLPLGGTRDVLILCADQLYRMDFCRLLQAHRDGKADVTIAVLPVHRHRTHQLGIVRVDKDDRIIELVEKPQPGQLEQLRLPAAWLERNEMAGRGRDYLANMGIYVFRREVLLDLLQAHPTATDLVTQIVARIVQSHRVQAYPFTGYWEDLGTIAAYHEANLALASANPPFDFHSREGIIYTRMRFLPPSRTQGAQLEECLVSDGCLIERGASLQRCVVGVRTRIGPHVTLHETVVNGAGIYETERERTANRSAGIPDLGIGEGSVIERAILDRDCRIGANVRIVNRRNLAEGEGDNYVIRNGIVVIPDGAIIPDGTVI